MMDENIVTQRVDKRETIFNFLPQELFTRDTVIIEVNALMYYKIKDVQLAVYEVDDLLGALSNTAQTQLKEIFGNMTFSQALLSQKQINDHLAGEFSRIFATWGIEVQRMELLGLAPNASTLATMKKQMVAERTRRGEFVRSEGKKAAAKLTAEGSKVVQINIGLADQESLRKRSEGDAGARVELASAESQALEILGTTIQSDGGSNVDYMIAQKFMKVVGDMESTPDKVLYLPYLAVGMDGAVGSLKHAYGTGANPNIRSRSKVDR